MHNLKDFFFLMNGLEDVWLMMIMKISGMNSIFIES